MDIGLPILGTVLVLAGALLLHDLYARMLVVILGVFLIEAGVGKLAHPLLPSERKFKALREEVDDFIGLVRRLNTAALEIQAGDHTAEARFDGTRLAMLESVDRMTAFAGDPMVPTPPRSTPPRIAPVPKR